MTDLSSLIADQWQDISTAPKDRTSVIIAVPTKNMDDFHVGEAYFDPENYGDGDWWWAGTHHADYHSGPVSELNFHGPMFWQPMPEPPTLRALQQKGSSNG